MFCMLLMSVAPMIMKRIVIIFVLCCCVSLAVADDTDISPAFYTNLGYRVTSSQLVSPTDWEKTEFALVQKRVIQIKSLKQVKEKPDWYYRFSIIVEHFPSDDNARARESRLLETPPKTSAPDTKAYPLRKAFRNEKVLYTVSTDVSLYFDTQLDTVLEAMKTEILKDKKGTTGHSTLSDEGAPSAEK